MADFLTTLGASSRIEEIINYSKEELFLISPFYQLSDVFYSRLSEASQRGVDITIVFGKDRLKDKEYQSFANIPSVDLYYCHNLHAKCYFGWPESDSVLYIASFNNRKNFKLFVMIYSDCRLHR